MPKMPKIAVSLRSGFHVNQAAFHNFRHFSSF